MISAPNMASGQPSDRHASRGATFAASGRSGRSMGRSSGDWEMIGAGQHASVSHRDAGGDGFPRPRNAFDPAASNCRAWSVEFDEAAPTNSAT